MTEHKFSKEIVAIQEAVEKYIEKHEGNVFVSINIGAFDEESFVIDDFISSYGIKEVLEIGLGDHLKALKKEKDDFINW